MNEHPLKKFCRENNITQTKVAQEAGLHPSYITHIIKKRKIPSVPAALLIERATGFKVSAITILGLDCKQN